MRKIIIPLTTACCLTFGCIPVSAMSPSEIGKWIAYGILWNLRIPN